MTGHPGRMVKGNRRGSYRRVIILVPPPLNSRISARGPTVGLPSLSRSRPCTAPPYRTLNLQTILAKGKVAGSIPAGRSTMRGRTAAVRLAHNQEVAGPSPAPATEHDRTLKSDGSRYNRIGKLYACSLASDKQTIRGNPRSRNMPELSRTDRWPNSGRSGGDRVLAPMGPWRNGKR